jgi:hypothetical protein
LARRQEPIVQLADMGSFQLSHRMTDGVEHTANLLIATLMKNDFEPSI